MLIAWAGAGVGSNAVESLFFARFGPRNLPVMYVALGLASFPVTFAMSALLARADRRRVLVGIPIGLAAITGVLRLALILDAPWIYPLLWLSMMVGWLVLAFDTWGLAGMVHDTRQAKRLFPLYGAGLILGGALGGLATRPLVGWLHVENLLLVWGASLVATSFVANGLPGRTQSRRRIGRRPARQSVFDGVRESVRYIRSSPLLRWMSLAILLSSVLYFSLALPFARAVTARFPAPDDLAGFLGLFSAATNAGALVLSLGVANWLFSRLGVPMALAILPALYLMGFAALIMTGPTLMPLIVFRFTQWVWTYGVWSIGWQALWEVVAPEQRQQAKAFMDGGPMQWGVLLAGMVLLLSQHLLTDRQFFAIAAAIAIASVAASLMVRDAYRRALVDALRAGWPEVFVAEEEPFGGVVADRVAQAALWSAMNDEDPAIRRVAAEILSSVPQSEGELVMRRGLADEDPTVRTAVLRAFMRAGTIEALPLVLPLLHDSNASVRAVAASAAVACSRGRDGVLTSLRPLLSDPDPAVRVPAAQGLLRNESDEEALRVLRGLASSTDPDVRAAAVSALGQLGLEPNLVIDRLQDEEPSARRAAARALPFLGATRAMGPLLDALADEDPTVREAVADALVSLGDVVGDPVARYLGDARREATALAVLVRLPNADREILPSYARGERARALRYHGLWQALSTADNERVQLLAAELRHRALRHAEHAVHALAPLGDQDSIEVAIQNATSRDPSQRANALETLEAIADPDLVRPLLAVWEPVPGSAPPNGAVLRSLLEEDDAWIRACAAFAFGALGDTGLCETIEVLAREDPNPMVREAAARALKGDGPVETVTTLSLMERMMALQRVPLFRELSPEDLKHVAEVLTENVYVDGTVIAVQGEPGDVMHVVVSGDVRVVRVGDHPAEVARRGPGYIVGEMAILAEQPRMADLIALGHVRTLSIDRKHFQRILRERPDAALAVMRELCLRLLEAHTGRRAAV